MAAVGDTRPPSRLRAERRPVNKCVSGARRLPLQPLLVRLLVALLPVACRAADAGDLYCGKDNCYNLLGLSKDASAGDVKKAFRKLALQWHPDKNKNPDAEKRFRKISRANEVLSDEKLRRAYNYYLEHPEDHYTHYYQYYHAEYAPETPLWAVVLGVLTFLSGLQYLNQHWKYSSMMRAIKYQPQFKRRVNERLEAEVAAAKGKLGKLERELLKDRLETQVLESEVHVGGGGFSKPCLRSLVLVSAACLPWTLSVTIYEAFRWHYRFNVKKEEYGPEERAYLTRKALGLTAGRWESMEDQREELVARELWVRENLEAFHKEKEEELQQRLAKSGAYKRQKRWMKNHG